MSSSKRCRVHWIAFIVSGLNLELPLKTVNNSIVLFGVEITFIMTVFASVSVGLQSLGEDISDVRLKHITAKIQAAEQQEVTLLANFFFRIFFVFLSTFPFSLSSPVLVLTCQVTARMTVFESVQELCNLMTELAIEEGELSLLDKKVLLKNLAILGISKSMIEELTTRKKHYNELKRQRTLQRNELMQSIQAFYVKLAVPEVEIRAFQSKLRDLSLQVLAEVSFVAAGLTTNLCWVLTIFLLLSLF